MLTSDGTYQITAAWESGLSNGANVGEILGLMVTGVVAERYGYRKTIAGALIMVVRQLVRASSTASLLTCADLFHLPDLLCRQHPNVARW